MSYRQLIIARKDLNMGPGKLAAQVSHASMAFLTHQIKMNAMPLTNFMCNDIEINFEDIKVAYNYINI